jgi:hypothetical protein
MSEIRIDPLVQAAFLAGRGNSASEIASAVGARSPEAITEALRLYNIRLDPKPFGTRVVPVPVEGPDQKRLLPHAVARGLDLAGLCRRILATVAREISIEGLLDDKGR